MNGAAKSVSEDHPGSSMRRIVLSDLQVGEPLWWDVFDVAGHLLLCKGYVLQSDRQLESLLERGLYVDQEEYVQALTERQEATVRVRPQLPSVVRRLNQIHGQVGPVLTAIVNGAAPPNAQREILDAADGIIQAVEFNADIALAWIVFAAAGREYAVHHCIQAAILAVVVATTMKKSVDQVTSVAASALTMNVGMLALQERLQHKAGALDAEETATIKQHPCVSVDLLRKAGITDSQWLAQVLFHHENIDGSGYPYGRSSSDIPELAQVISVADRYTARIAPRSYRSGLLPNEALRGLLLEGGKTIDPLIAAYFIRALGIYPPGSVVRLNNGEVAVVYKRGSNAAAPPVLSVTSPRGAPLDRPQRRSTDQELHTIREAIAASSVDVSFDMEILWGKEAAL
jgi:HD-GYP domain-containing protein (c-di-GMP phosphodiesterase class II)